MNQLTSVVQELARLLTTGVAAQSAQPLEGAAQGVPAASSSDALGSYKPGGPQIPLLKLRATNASTYRVGASTRFPFKFLQRVFVLRR